MDVPRLGVKLALQLLVYATAKAMQGLSRVCDLHDSSQQGGILNPLSESRDQTHTLMDTCWVRNPLCRNGNSGSSILDSGNKVTESGGIFSPGSGGYDF